MEVLGPLGLVPWSMANLLSIKGEHGVLTNIVDTITPTMDVWELLARPNAREVVSQNVATAAKGPVVFSSLNPTAGQCWLVSGFGWTATMAAGDSLRARGILVGTQGQGLRQITDENTGTAGIVLASYLRVAPFILYSGESLQVFAHDLVTAGNITIGATATIYRFHA